jgi:hypothetical protein
VTVSRASASRLVGSIRSWLSRHGTPITAVVWLVVLLALWANGGNAPSVDPVLRWLAPWLVILAICGIAIAFRVGERRPTDRPKQTFDLRMGTTLLVVFGLDAVFRLDEVQDSLNALQIWLWLGLVLAPAFYAAEVVGRRALRVRDDVGRRAPGWMAPTFVALLSVLALSLAWAANDLVASGHLVPPGPCDPPPGWTCYPDLDPVRTIPALSADALMWSGAILAIGVLLRLLGQLRAASVMLAAVYVGLVFWTTRVVSELVSGRLILPGGPVASLALLAAAAISLVAAILVANVATTSPAWAQRLVRSGVLLLDRGWERA